MKIFIKKTVLLLIPLLLILGTPNYLAFIYGEAFVDFEKVIEGDRFELIGQKFSESNTLWLKTKIINKRKPLIVALGSSRVLQFRRQMFKDEFFNYGYTTTKNSTILPTLKLVSRESKLKYLIVGIDQWNFNKSWDKTSYPNYQSRFPRLKNSLDVVSLFTLVTEILKFEGNHTSSKGKIGLNAIHHGNGFRRDGSRNYGVLIDKLFKGDTTYEDYKFQDTFRRIEDGNRRFQYGNKIDTSQLNYIYDLIDYCESNDIKLIFFLPPFAPTVWKVMTESGNYSYISDLDNHMKTISMKYDIPYFNFSGPGVLNYTDEEMIDGFHGSESVYSKILLHIACENSDFAEIIDTEVIHGALESRESLNIFD